jgi:hypothetical protein
MILNAIRYIPISNGPVRNLRSQNAIIIIGTSTHFLLQMYLMPRSLIRNWKNALHEMWNKLRDTLLVKIWKVKISWRSAYLKDEPVIQSNCLLLMLNTQCSSKEEKWKCRHQRTIPQEYTRGFDLQIHNWPHWHAVLHNSLREKFKALPSLGKEASR